MTQITINSTDSKKILPQNALQNVSCGKFFEQFLDSQKISPTKSNGLSPEAVVTYRSETTDILNHCNPMMPHRHKRLHTWLLVMYRAVKLCHLLV